MDVHEIFATLTDPSPSTAGETVYTKALRMLDAYFTPQVNVPYERHVFRQMVQQDSETVYQFVMHLRHQAENCMFEEQKEEQIQDQVIDECRSRKLDLKLNQVVE